jgi:cobalt/nickel transport system permease protein
MAHIHLEDGAFTPFMVLLWWAVALAFIAGALWLLRPAAKPDRKRITLAAFCAAAAFAVFQVSIPVAGGVHLNLTPLIGILAGPVFGILIVFTTNILSSAIGHGGWGLIGANTAVNVTEVLVAFAVFRALKNPVPDLFSRAGIATLLGLLAGNAVMIGIILVSGIQGVHQTPEQVLAGLSLIAIINMGVAVIEALVTALVVSYIGKMRPDLLEGGWR